MRKLSVFYEHILQACEQSGKTIPEVLAFCREQGISAVEMNYSLFASEREVIAPMLSDAGLVISCMHETFDFSHDTDLGRAQQMLDTAASQQVSRVLFVAGALETAEAAELAACSSTYEATSTFMAKNKSIQNMVHALSSLAEYAALRGVTITLEDFDGFLQPFARTYPLLWFMEHVPGLRYTLDIGNFAFSDEDVSYAAWLLKDYIVHVHCKDRAESPLVHGRFCRGLGQTPAGTGYLPMAKLLTDLEACDYDGYLAIEHFDAPDQLSFIEQSAAFLRQWVSEQFRLFHKRSDFRKISYFRGEIQQGKYVEKILYYLWFFRIFSLLSMENMVN